MLGEIADLLEIRADNPFKIRAYRNAAETVVAEPSRVADMPDAALRELPGIGKDLAQRIREIADTGDTPYRQELLAAFPPTLLDLLRLQGVGPKTVKRLYDELGVASLDTLEAACKDGRVSALKGMGDKKQALILKAIEERKRYAGRHLAAQVEKAARVVVSHLKASYPDADFTPVGSLRRGVETCGEVSKLRIPRAKPAEPADATGSAVTSAVTVLETTDVASENGGGGGSRTRVRECFRSSVYACRHAI